MRGLENLKVTVKVEDLLDAMKRNRVHHEAIVEEARKGYMERAGEALRARLAELSAGKLSSLAFALNPPVSHIAEYDTVIGMLEMATEETLMLGALEYRQFVADKWDWTREFYCANSAYSQTARRVLNNQDE